MVVQPLAPGTTTAVLVEGTSDREAVRVPARRSGIDLVGRSVAGADEAVELLLPARLRA